MILMDSFESIHYDAFGDVTYVVTYYERCNIFLL